VPAIPPKYHNQNYRSVMDNKTPDRLRPVLPEGKLSNSSGASTQKVSDISSSSNYERGDLDSLPSPEPTLPPAGTKAGDEMRVSLLSRVDESLTSPVSPEIPISGGGWKGAVWGYGAREPPRPADWRPPYPPRTQGRNENESWWKR
jgi:hypothetical protein